MKIKIRQDAQKAYLLDRGFGFSQSWHDLMATIAGNTYEVETEFLFKDQFNIGKVEGSENGLRIMNYLVEEIFDDVRVILQRCNWCGKNSLRRLEECPHCLKKEYLEDLTPKISNAESLILEMVYNNKG